MASRALDRDSRTATTVPETWDDATHSIEVVFSTGARAMKFDRKRGVPWIEDLPLRGMDVTDLSAGAHVLRTHGMDPKTGEGLDAVIGSVVPGTARVVSDTEARARITPSRAPGKAEVVQDIRDGVIRKWSYGYRRVGRPTVATDAESGLEVRSWAKHVPDEISAVAIPADGGTNTRSRDTEDTDMPEGTQDVRQAPDDAALHAAREEGRRAEATRQDTIRKLAAKVRLSEDDIRSMLSDPAVTVEAAQTRMLDLVAQRDAASPTFAGRAAVTRDEADTRREAMIDGLAYRAHAVGTPRSWPARTSTSACATSRVTDRPISSACSSAKRFAASKSGSANRFRVSSAKRFASSSANRFHAGSAKWFGAGSAKRFRLG